MDNPFQSPAILSFCPGVLGLERGLKRVIGSINIMAYVEIEAFIIANLVAGMESGVLDPAPIWTDAKTFDAQPFHGKIHGIVGGYPCPGESLAGLREGHLYKGFLWPAFRKIIAAARPIWCFFENVDDHLTGTYPIVQRSLRNMGYAVEAGIYSANEVGAPHERKRLFILAIANGSGFRGGYTRGFFPEVIDGCEELSDTRCTGLQAPRSITRQTTNVTIEQSCNDQLANSNGQREQLSIIRKHPTVKQSFSNNEKICFGPWPAAPGSWPHSFEEPRTIEPRVGSTVNGYNFREDLLRAYGNSVVEQTAELAFRDLMHKHNLSNLLPH